MLHTCVLPEVPVNVKGGDVERGLFAPLAHEDVGEEDTAQEEEGVCCQRGVHYQHLAEAPIVLQAECKRLLSPSYALVRGQSTFFFSSNSML